VLGEVDDVRSSIRVPAELQAKPGNWNEFVRASRRSGAVIHACRFHAIGATNSSHIDGRWMRRAVVAKPPQVNMATQMS
jgi:hypothetical protein